MRRAIIVTALVAGVVIITAVAVALSTLQRAADAALETAQRTISERTKVVLEAGRVSVALLPEPSVVIQGVNVRAPRADSAAVEGGTIRLVAEPALLLRAGFRLRRVEVTGTRLTLAASESNAFWAVVTAAREIPAPVTLEHCTLKLVRGGAVPDFEATSIGLQLEAAEGAVSFRGTLSPLGPASHADLEGEWRPGVGRTGGDALRLRLDIRDAQADALAGLVPGLGTAQIRGGTHFEISAEGFVGERGTETMPAEPLKGRVRAETDIELFGLRKAAVFETKFWLDERRWVLDSGEGRWGERAFTYAGWIARGNQANPLNLRVGLREVSVADVLADYGIAERWRPRAVVSGEIRIGGTMDERLVRYVASAPDVRFDGWSSVPISAGPTKVTGSLLAINAEAAGTLTTDVLALGRLSLPEALVGATWWKNELNVVSLARPYWGGKVDAAINYSPQKSPDVEGGVQLRGVRAAATLESLFPDVRVGLEGRANVGIKGGYNADGLWYQGRIAMGSGTVARGLLRSVVERVAEAAGSERTLDDALVVAHPDLSAERMAFTKLAAAFSFKQGSTAVELSKLPCTDADIRASGSLDEEGRLEANGAAVLTPELAKALSARLPELQKLAAADGSLTIAFRLVGPIENPQVALAPSFATAFERARSGETVEPFVAPAAQPLAVDPELLDESLVE